LPKPEPANLFFCTPDGWKSNETIIDNPIIIGTTITFDSMNLRHPPFFCFTHLVLIEILLSFSQRYLLGGFYHFNDNRRFSYFVRLYRYVQCYSANHNHRWRYYYNPYRWPQYDRSDIWRWMFTSSTPRRCKQRRYDGFFAPL